MAEKQTRQMKSMTSSKEMKAMKREVPTGIKIISILYYIGAAISLLVGILAIVGAGFADAIIEAIPGFSEISAGAVGAVIAIIGIVLIAFAILGYFIGKGLWKGKKWARIVAIILAVLGILNAILSMASGVVSGIFWLIVDGLIAWYLWFSKEAKAYFN